jgi:hypothetical protein
MNAHYNESDEIDTESYTYHQEPNKDNDTHSVTSYEENIALESSDFGNYDAGSRRGRQYHD